MPIDPSPVQTKFSASTIRVKTRRSLSDVLSNIISTLPSRSSPTSPTEQLSIPTADTVLSKITTGDLRRSKHVGTGGFGDVLRLSHPAIGTVALKRLRLSSSKDSADDQRRRALREGGTWRQLRHPHILPCIGVLEAVGNLFLVSPYIENGPVDQYLRGNPKADRFKLLRETADALAYLHESGIVHGDVKGANVLVGRDGEALLGDFGLAKSEGADTSIGLHGVGSVRWKSIELLLDEDTKTFASDVWAFGMYIYEVLSGMLPFHEHPQDTAVILAITVRHERPPRYPSHSYDGRAHLGLWDLMDDCCKDNPLERIGMRKAFWRLCLPSTPAPSTSIEFSREVAPGEAGIYHGQFIVRRNEGNSTMAFRRLSFSLGSGECAEQRRKFWLTEADWASLDPHPNILSLYATFICNNEALFVTYRSITPSDELHTQLDDYLRQKPDADRVNLLTGCAAGLAYLHASGLILGQPVEAHAFVSSKEVLLLSPSPLENEYFQENAIRWRSPDVLHGAPPSMPSDVWSFGMSAYHILSGQMPYGDLAHNEISTAIISGKLPSVKDIGKNWLRDCSILKGSILSCWDAVPQSRLSMKDIHQTLESRLNKRWAVHKLGIPQAVVSPDGALLACKPSTAPVIVVSDVASARVANELVIGSDSGVVLDMAFSPSTVGRPLLAVQFTQARQGIQLWDVQSQTRMVHLLVSPGMPGTFECLTWSPDGAYVIAGVRDHAWVLVWDVAYALETEQITLRGRQTYRTVLEPSDQGIIKKLRFSPDSEVLVVLGTIHITTKIWEQEGSSLLFAPPRGELRIPEPETAVAYGISPDARYAAVGANTGLVRIWNVEGQGKFPLIWEIHACGPGAVRELTFSGDSRSVATLSLTDGCLRIWDITSKSQRKNVLKITGGPYWADDKIGSVLWLPDGTNRNVVVGLSNGIMQVVHLVEETDV